MAERTDDPPQTRRTIVVGLILTAVAGLVDAVGYLALQHVLPANMSGNTVESGLHWLHGQGHSAHWKLWAVASFVLGAMISGVLHQRSKRHNLKRTVPWALSLETVLLLGWMVLGHGAPGVDLTPGASLSAYTRLTLAALALGLQNASLTQVGPVHAFTTHVTGTLTKFAETAVGAGFWFKDRLAQGSPSQRARLFSDALREKDVRTALIMAGLWGVFFGGAILGGALYARWWTDALLAPAIVLAFTAVGSWRWAR